MICNYHFYNIIVVTYHTTMCNNIVNVRCQVLAPPLCPYTGRVPIPAPPKNHYYYFSSQYQTL
jgi:hypothetical protein